MQKNVRGFWENQKKIVDAMQAFSNDWFERRRTGTRAALDTAERMCRADTPVAFFREYQEWASGVFQRVMTDGLACHQKFLTVTGTFALAQPLAPVDSCQEAEPSNTEARPAARSRAA